MIVKVSINFPELFTKTIDRIVYTTMALKGIADIRSRVQQGVYLQGSTGGSEYSTNPMPLPYGALVAILGKQAVKNEGYRIYKNKNGKLMAVLPGGYKKWRQLNSKSDSPVTMNWSGRMMRNLGIEKYESDAVWLGFPAASEQRKADFQHQGAGKSRVIRNFMGFTDKEIGGLGDIAVKAIIKLNKFE